MRKSRMIRFKGNLIYSFSKQVHWRLINLLNV